MQRPQRRSIYSFFILFILVFFIFDTALAAQAEKNKDKKPAEEVIDSAAKAKAEEKMDKGFI